MEFQRFGVGQPLFNTQGHTLFGSFLGGNGVNNDNNESIWSNRTGELDLVVREGEAAPGTDAVFGAANSIFVLGNDGKTVTLAFTSLALDMANSLDVSLSNAITDINATAKTQVLAQAIAANGETTKPSVVSATETGLNQVTVVFNEAMDETTAEVAGNYTWSAVITTTAATLQTDGTMVILTTIGDPSILALTVASVRDINININNAFTSGLFP